MAGRGSSFREGRESIGGGGSKISKQLSRFRQDRTVE